MELGADACVCFLVCSARDLSTAMTRFGREHGMIRASVARRKSKATDPVDLTHPMPTVLVRWMWFREVADPLPLR